MLLKLDHVPNKIGIFELPPPRSFSWFVYFVCCPDKSAPKSQFWEFFQLAHRIRLKNFQRPGRHFLTVLKLPRRLGSISADANWRGRRRSRSAGGVFWGWRMAFFLFNVLFMVFSLFFHDFSLFFMVFSTSNYPIVEKYRTLNWLLLVRMSCILSFDVSLRWKMH